MAEEHVGFANTLDSKGKFVDATKVKPFKDKSDAGKVRDASQTTPSSIVDFKTEGKGTNGAPAAVVPAPVEKPDEADASTSEEAEGKEADES